MSTKPSKKTIRWKNEPECSVCGFSANITDLWCPNCGGLMEIQPIKGTFFDTVASQWCFRDFLPHFSQEFSLLEGRTPVLMIKNEKELQGLNIKLEFRNPTGSFRDRATSLILSDACQSHQNEIVSASSGSYGISLAAYGARAQIQITNIVPNQTELSKIEQLKIYGSNLIKYGNNIDETIKYAEKYANEHDVYHPLPKSNILTIEGQKTIGLEIGQFNSQIKHIFIPRGSGTLILSVYRGLQDALKSGWIKKIPHIYSVALKRTADSKLIESLNEQTPLIQKIGEILEKTEGYELQIDPNEMISDAFNLAKKEGQFIEPASGSVISAARKFFSENSIAANNCLAVLSGSGLNALNIYASQMREMKKVVWGLSSKTTKKFEILSLIADQRASNGVEIWAILGKKQSKQSIYQNITLLEEQNLIEATMLDKKTKQYHLTSKGQQVFEKMADLIDLI